MANQPGAQRRHKPGRRPADSPRGVAFSALRAVHGAGAYANLVLPELIDEAGLSSRDAAFATELVAGTCRLEGSYDTIIEAAAKRPLTSLQPAVVDILRLGTHQLLSLRTPASAAVATSVELARERIGERVSGVVNAILRKVGSRDLDAWFDELSRGLSPHEALGLRTGHPAWIVDMFADLLPSDELPAVLDADNEPPVPMLAVRPGLAQVAELVAAGATPAQWSPWGASRSGNPAAVPAVAQGRAGVQDEGSQLVILALTRAYAEDGDHAADTWLDLCSGPGGKSALLAGLAPQQGSWLLSAEAQPHRARLVARALRGYPASSYHVVTADGTRPAWRRDACGLVLVDVPCSGLGALRRRPEARWRRTPGTIAELAGLQRALLATAIDSTRPGGVIGYVTCSPHRAETAEVIADVVARRSDIEIVDAPALLPQVPNAIAATDARFLQLWPHRHRTDAMFAAVLHKH